MYLVKRVEQELVVVREESSLTPYLTAPAGVHPGALELTGVHPGAPGCIPVKLDEIYCTPMKKNEIYSTLMKFCR